jgi:hypothetical protein
MHGQDRRVFQRVPLKVPCGLTNPLFGLETTGTTIDISLDGLGLTAPVNWSEGNHIRIQFKESMLDAEAVIVFRKEEAPVFRYGVRFRKAGLFQILKLRRFLKKHYSGPLSL